MRLANQKAYVAIKQNLYSISFNTSKFTSHNSSLLNLTRTKMYYIQMKQTTLKTDKVEHISQDHVQDLQDRTHKHIMSLW